MKIETIYYLERVNKGNYEHFEMSATAKVEDGEDAMTAMLSLKTVVNTSLNYKVSEIMNPKEVEVKEEIKKEARELRKLKEELKKELK